MTDEKMTMSVTFNRGDSYSDFVMEYGDDPGFMYFSVKDGDSDEATYVQCYRTLDEMEYLAHRILDAVAYQRKQYTPEPVREWEPPYDEPVPESEPTFGEAGRIANVLMLCRGDRKKAAEHLGISERTLYRKIKEYMIEG